MLTKQVGFYFSLWFGAEGEYSRWKCSINSSFIYMLTNAEDRTMSKEVMFSIILLYNTLPRITK